MARPPKFRNVGLLDLELLYWEDLVATASGINPPGLVSDPDRDSDGTLLFASNATQMVAVGFHLPHSWKEGGFIQPHVHWKKTSDEAGDVVWQQRYYISCEGELSTAWSSWLIKDSRSETLGSTQIEIVDAFADIDMVGYPMSSNLIFQLQRDYDATLDNYGADARLIELDLHVQKDAPGSLARFAKNTVGV